jgi:hypothetical protein
MADNKKQKLYISLQLQIQTALKAILDKNGKEAQQVDLSLTDVAFCLGSASASTFYEVLRQEGQRSGFVLDQKEDMLAMRENLLLGFDEKLSLIEDPIEFSKVAVSSEMH